MQESRSLFQIVDQVIQSFHTRSSFQHITFQNQVPLHIGNVNHNADLIIFLLVLLVESIIKFISVQGSVEIGAKNKANNFEMWVRDNGKGIPDDIKDLIFERQFQTDNKQSQNDLGLSIVKRILNFYGGKIWVETDVKYGNIFIFSVPNHD
jgi:signal transduction histidine kinase